MPSSAVRPMVCADRTRREAIRDASAAAGAALAASTAPLLLRLGRAFAEATGDDEAMLEEAVRLEQAAAVSYGAFTETALLDKQLADTAMLFSRQARQHAEVLGRRLVSLGGSRPEPPRPPEIDGLRAISSPSGFLEFAIGLENGALRTYLDGLGGIVDPGLMRTWAQVAANHGQHLVVLRQELSAEPADWVPAAFETGSSPPPA
jgi:ferritin-like protein